MSLQKREKDGSIIGEAEITTKGTPFSTKGIGFRCKGHLISYVWRDESCICLLFHWSACFTQKGSLLRAADASGEEVEKIPHFFIDKQWWRNGRQRGSDSGCGIWWKRSCFPLAFSQPRKGHAWIPMVSIVRAQQKCMHFQYCVLSTTSRAMRCGNFRRWSQLVPMSIGSRIIE